jgi:hypothetical protein
MTPSLDALSEGVTPTCAGGSHNSGGFVSSCRDGRHFLHTIMQGGSGWKTLYIRNFGGGGETLGDELQNVNANTSWKVDCVRNKQISKGSSVVLGELRGSGPKLQRGCRGIQLHLKVRRTSTKAHVDKHVEYNGPAVWFGAGFLDKFRNKVLEEFFPLPGALGRRSSNNQTGYGAAVFAGFIDLMVTILLYTCKEKIILETATSNIRSEVVNWAREASKRSSNRDITGRCGHGSSRIRRKKLVTSGDQKANESNACIRIEMNTIRLEIGRRGHKRTQKLQLGIAHTSDLMTKEGGKARKIGLEPVRNKSRKRRRDNNICRRIGKWVTMKSLHMVGNLTMRANREVIAGAGIADEVWQDGGRKQLDAGQGRKGAFKNRPLRAAHKLIGTTNRW